MFEYFLATVNTVVGSGDAASSAASAADTAASTSSGGGLSMSWIFIYIIVIFVAMYFMSIRPQKKRQKELEEMRNKIKPGDSVLCNNGMYGKVVDVTAGMNKGIRVPVVKSEIALVKEPNLSNKESEPVVEEKRGLFGFKKKKEEAPAEETKKENPIEDK